MASTVWKLYDADSVKGTCKVVSDDAGAMTLTVDAVAAAVSGAVSATTLTASGAVTLSDSSLILAADLPSGNDTSNRSIGQVYVDTLGSVKIGLG